MEMLSKREREMTQIRVYALYGFAAMYTIGVLGHFGMRKGTMPYFKDVIMHSILGVSGSYCAH